MRLLINSNDQLQNQKSTPLNSINSKSTYKSNQTQVTPCSSDDYVFVNYEPNNKANIRLIKQQLQQQQQQGSTVTTSMNTKDTTANNNDDDEYLQSTVL